MMFELKVQKNKPLCIREIAEDRALLSALPTESTLVQDCHIEQDLNHIEIRRIVDCHRKGILQSQKAI